MDKCCGTCKWHKFENISDGFVCVNSDSDYCADWTEYGDSCEEWEKKMSDRYLYRAKRTDNGEWIVGSLERKRK